MGPLAGQARLAVDDLSGKSETSLSQSVTFSSFYLHRRPYAADNTQAMGEGSPRG